MAGLSESFGERIVVDLQLGNLFVLVRRHADELGLFEDVSPERRVGQLHDVRGADQVKARLVFVHRIENRLKKERKMV